MNALEKITLEIKAIFLHLPQEELISLELINFSKGHEGPDMGRCVCVCVPDMGRCVCVCVCVCVPDMGLCVCVCVCVCVCMLEVGGKGQGCQLQNSK